MPSGSNPANSKQSRAAWLTPQTLFKVAAFFNLNAIWGHTLNGFISVYPAVRAIPSLPQYAVGQHNARLGWNFMNAFFVVSGMVCNPLFTSLGNAMMVPLLISLLKKFMC
jgi:hypothetical protein